MPRTHSHQHPLAILGLMAMLGGCQTLAPTPEPVDPLAQAPAITRGLDAKGLSTLLVAELAGQRGDYQRASHGYLISAERYTTAELAERAALAARFAENPDDLERAARRWRTLAPDDKEPTLLLSSLAIQRGDWEQALDWQLEIARRHDPDTLVPFLESALDAGAPPSTLLARLRGVTPPASVHDTFELASALLEASTGLFSQAEDRLRRLTQRAPELEGLWRIRTAVALETQSPAEARTLARRGLTYDPGDPRLTLMLAQAELSLGNLSAAEDNTDALLEDSGDDPELRQALARFYLGEGQTDAARRLLLPLISDRNTPSQVFLLLGLIAEQDGEVDNALLYYRQVEEGEHFLGARANAANMLMTSDRLEDARTFLQVERLRHPDEASQLLALEVELLDENGATEAASMLLDQGVERYPGNTRLRYQRAMRAFAQGDYAAMERDLSDIIARDPDNANALNALGYTLADRNQPERLAEARRLIERAYELEPDNAAVLDSMGWIRYRQGDVADALSWLQRAWSAMPDQEVAAHLIEVLWQLGHRQRARELLESVQQRFDSQPAIEELLRRLPAIEPR